MKKNNCLQIVMGLLFFTFGNNIALAQHIDSTKKNIVAVNHFSSEQQILQALQNRPYFNYTVGAKTVFNIKEKNTQGKEFYFYVLAGLLLLFAGLKTVLNKYFDDLIDLFFRRSPKQRQLKQQVSQNALPSLFFNIFYVLVAGFYLSLLVQGLGKMSSSFWQLSVYCMAAISITYIGKYLVLKFTGWIFQLQSLTDSYIFIVFFVNKIIGVVLLPIVIAIALGNIGLKTAVIMLSWIVLLLLLIYRCVQTFRLLREGKSISIFHFILYLLAFEILPVPIIYKAISQYLQF